MNRSSKRSTPSTQNASLHRPFDNSSSLHAQLACVLLVLATFTVYWNGLKGVFIADDHVLTRRLPFFESLWLPETIASGIGGRPVLSLSFALNRDLVGPSPWHFRIVNIAIHAASALLLFGLVRRTLQRGNYLSMKNNSFMIEGRAPSAIRNQQLAIWIAFAVSLLWLVHPLQTASVTYIIQRAESLTGFFLLLTLYAAVRRFDGGNTAWTILAVAACLLGMATKQVMFAAPALVLLYDYTFVCGGIRTALRSHPGLYAGLACGWVLLSVMIAVWQMNDPWPELGARNPWPYALTQPSVILYYLRLSFWPIPIMMVYAWPYADTLWEIVPPLLAVGLLASLTLWGIWRRSWIGFLGAWFFLILAPSSSFAALEQIIQCHRMYLPLAAVSVVAVGGVYTILVHVSRLVGRGEQMTRVAGIVLLACAATALAFGTIQRNEAYHNEIAFWQGNVTSQPNSRAAQTALGAEYLIKKQTAEAESCFRKAIAADDSPLPVDAHYYLGLIALGSGRFDEALTHFRAAYAFRPYHAETVEKIGATFASQGNFAEATRHFEKTLAMRPNARVAAAAHNNLGTILSRQGNTEEAVAHYRSATQLQPNSPEAFGNLGSALVRLRRFSEAIGPYEAALRLSPKNADIHNNLGSTLLSLGRLEEAISHFRIALAIYPNHDMAQRNLQSALSAIRTRKSPSPGTNSAP